MGGALAVLVAVAPPAPARADTLRDAQWHLGFLRLRTAQTYSRGAGVVVGLVDSGVAASHPDLLGNVLAGTDLPDGGDGRVDDEGHGTAVAGLIAAHGRGDSGALGVAPQARILPVRTARFNLHLRNLDAAGIDWAAGHGARVICLAFTTQDTPELRRAVSDAQAADVVVIAAAGNRPESAGVGYPAAYPGVVAVAGVDRSGEHAPVSATGPAVVLAAPASGIVSTAPGGGYRTGTGTSDAAAIVAGVAALVRARFPDLSAAQVVHRLTATALDRGTPGRDAEYGYGIVDPVAALTTAVPPLDAAAGPTGAAPTPSPPADRAAQRGPRRTRWPAAPVRALLVGVLMVVLVGGALLTTASARTLVGARRRGGHPGG